MKEAGDSTQHMVKRQRGKRGERRDELTRDGSLDGKRSRNNQHPDFEATKGEKENSFRGNFEKLSGGEEICLKEKNITSKKN